MVLITFIYVVATIEICRANIKSAEATKEQLEESKHQFAENERLQMMPYFEIIVHDDIRDFVECIELTISNSNAENSTVIDRRISIKNIGLGVAKDFTYTWCNLDGCYLRNDLGFTAYSEFPYTLTYNNKSLSFSKNIFGRSRPILFGLPK